jgi:hypothetical protein
MSNIYCGNNSKSKDIIIGISVIGTRYQCLKKGIGKGLNLPMDKNYLGDYEAIDNRKIYCGNKNKLPKNYDYMGNLPQCLQKGIGVGKIKKTLNYNPNNYNLVFYVILYIILCIITFFILFYTKPLFITIQKDNETIIDIKKMLLYYIPSIIILAIIMIIIYNYRI